MVYMTAGRPVESQVLTQSHPMDPNDFIVEIGYLENTDTGQRGHGQRGHGQRGHGQHANSNPNCNPNPNYYFT